MTSTTTAIRPHLWYDTQAREAAELYIDIFPDARITDLSTLHDTPSGDVDIVSFELFGQGFQAISAGPHFRFTPALSLTVACQTPAEVDEYWKRLSEGGKELMPLQEYPFSERFGWTEDRWGLSWQVILAPGGSYANRITPTLLFTGDVAGRAEEALGFYASIFPGGEVADLTRYGAGEEPEREGTLKYGLCSLGVGWELAAMDSALEHGFTFNEAVSLIVECQTQEELDRYWNALSAVPEAEQCGWLKDRFGVSWQVVPTGFEEMMREGSDEQIARLTQAFLPMKKIDLAALRRAYEGS